MDTPEKKPIVSQKPKQEMITLNVKIGDITKSITIPKQNRIQAKFNGDQSQKVDR